MPTTEWTYLSDVERQTKAEFVEAVMSNAKFTQAIILTDILEGLAKRIADQQLQRGINPAEMTEAQRLHYASECVLALHAEVSELASSWSFASWKTIPTDIENIKREIIDCFFFLHNIAAMFFITPADLLKQFEWVLANNQARIDSGVHKEVQLSNE